MIHRRASLRSSLFPNVSFAMVALCALLLTAAEANAADRPARLQGNVQSAGAPLAGYKVSLYANFIDHGPAWKLLGSDTTNDAGHFEIAYSLPPGLVDDASILFFQAERGRRCWRARSDSGPARRHRSS